MTPPQARSLAACALWAAAACAAVPAAAQPARKRLAGLVVRSREYVVRREPRREEEFIGEVSYRQLGREAHADWALRETETERWTARGNVRLLWRLEDKTAVSARGHLARHDGASERGSLLPREGELLAFESRRPGLPEPDRGAARRLGWDAASETVRVEGDVHLWGPSGEAWSEEADYRHDARLLTLTGRRPVLSAAGDAWIGAVQADRIAAFGSRPAPGEDRAPLRRVSADGAVRGWLLFKDRPVVLGGL